MLYECSRSKCGHERISKYPPKMLHRMCDINDLKFMKTAQAITPLSFTESIRNYLSQLPDVTRSPEDLNQIITICTTQCKRLGTGQWGETKYEGCPSFGRPCTGAFEKWMASLADAKTWCEQWGPAQGLFNT